MQWKLLAVLFGYVAACTCDTRLDLYGPPDRYQSSQENGYERAARPSSGRLSVISEYSISPRDSGAGTTQFLRSGVRSSGGSAGGSGGGGSAGGSGGGSAGGNERGDDAKASCSMRMSGPPIPPAGLNADTFSTRLYQSLSTANPGRNLVFSPLSLRTLLAFVYMGAEGRSAQELYSGLNIPQDKREVAYVFDKLLQDQQRTDSAKLIMANRMYYNSNLKACNTNVLRIFQTETEPIDFGAQSAAASKINGWVSQQTQNRINNLVSPQAIDGSTQAILVNAIYFKAKWLKDFSVADTEPQAFYESRQKRSTVKMMFTEDEFRLKQFPDLKAQVLDMPYRDSNLSMLVILPNDIDGLPEVEQRLGNTDFNRLAAQLEPQDVTVRLPQFRIDFELDMLESLKKLGISQVFSNDSQLKGFFKNNKGPVRISKVQHKAFITVNEAGTEAAAASYAKVLPLSLTAANYFTADHPFMFVIRGPNAVYFIGRYVNV